MKRTLNLVSLTLLVFGSFLTACQPAVEPPAPLIVLIDNDEGPLTPANFNTFIGFWLVGWVYDPLFVRTPALQAVPALAVEALPSTDGLTWEIRLREGIQWHDGQPFTSRDVVFSYKFLIEAGRAQALNVIDTIEADGDLALTIKLKEPSPFFLDEGLAGYYIMPEHIWSDQDPVSGELSQFQGAIGTGAFKLVNVAPGESYTFEANSDYYLGTPRVDQIIVKIVKDRTQQVNQLQTGDAAAILSSIPPSLVGELMSDPDIDIAQGSDFFNYVLYTNASRPPFDRVEVRQAISQAIDTEKLTETVMLGYGIPLPLSYYHPDLPWAIGLPHVYDPENARLLLDQAGILDSDQDGVREFEGEPLRYEILCDANSPVEIRSTELIGGWLKDLGLETQQRCLDIDTEVTFIWPNFVAVPDPDYDLAIWGWSSSPQFQRGFLRFMINQDFGGLGWANLTGMYDGELDKLTAEYVTSPDPARQEALNRHDSRAFCRGSAVYPPLFTRR